MGSDPSATWPGGGWAQNINNLESLITTAQTRELCNTQKPHSYNEIIINTSFVRKKLSNCKTFMLNLRTKLKSRIILAHFKL